MSNTAKSRPGVSAGSPQAPVSRARTEQRPSALERTAGWFHRLVQGRSTPAKPPITKRVDVADDPLAAFASEDAPVSVDGRSIPQPPDVPDMPDMPDMIVVSGVSGMPGVPGMTEVRSEHVAPDRGSVPRPGVPLSKAPASGRAAAGRLALVAGAAIVLLAGLATFGARYNDGLASASAAALGTFSIDTEPTGAAVIIDGQSRGSTPFKASLAPGAHTVIVRHGAEERRVPLMLAAGTEVVHHVEFGAVKPAPMVGAISVVTDPPGAHVLVDGRARGASPITLTDLLAADYKVSVTSETGAAERTVAVRAGETASVVFSLPRASGPLAGWAAVSSPFDVQVLEDNSIIGTGRNSKIMMPAGKHTFSIVSQALGYQDTRTVDVAAGKVATIQVDAPKVIVNVNARPWADVFIDGKNVGQTPIGNLSLAIGTYDVVFRHPEFGERRQTVTVTARGANRVAVDMTK